MARLVLGTDINNTGTSSLVRDVSPEYYKVFDVKNGELINSTAVDKIVNLDGVTKLGEYILYKAYVGNDNLNGKIDLSSIQYIGQYALNNTFRDCTNITEIDLSGLIKITSGYQYNCYGICKGCISLISVNLHNLTESRAEAFCEAFFGCTSLVSVDLSNLVKIEGEMSCNRMFYGCKSLQSISIPNLTTITGYKSFGEAFTGSALSNMSFPKLNNINGTGTLANTFSGCTNLTSISFDSLTTTSFGSYTDQFNNMLYGVIGCTIHFPSNLESKIQTLQGYPTFGGTNTILAFDLPATE